jgi:hypothetical protein
MKAMRTIAVALAMFCLRAQTPLPPDLEALTKIRTRMTFHLEHQPNYTCVETIERSSRAKTGKLKVVDTLRLEVALVDGREMFAWPGSKEFDHFDLTKMVTSGAIGNGDFGGFAKALFTTSSATFHYVGQEDFRGKKAIRFNYDVPRLISGYRVRVATASAIVGFHGLFYADPATFDVERIEVIADDLPPDLLLSSVDDKIDYAVARIGDGDFLLPSQSELSMTGILGGEEHNHLKFSSCRQFSGESVITFADVPAAKEAAPIPLREFDLPKGLELDLEIAQDIDLRTAAVGDPVEVRTNRDLKQKGAILIPKGATATGRITRFERYDSYSILGVEFPEIEAPGILARMKGSLDRIVGINQARARSPLHGRTPLQPGEGIFVVNATERRLPHRCIMFWRT